MKKIDDQDGDGLVLIVDDQVENLQMLSYYLPDYKKTYATSGNEAIHSAFEMKPDVILLDIMMPDIDGFEVCKILKNDESTKEIPIIFVTALNQIHNMVKGFHLGGSDYITKPYQREEISVRVKNQYDLKKAKETIISQYNHLQYLNYEKTKFIGLVAHDLKNPLKVVQGFSQLIHDKLEAFSREEITEFILDIKHSADSMLKIISDILIINEIDEERIDMSPENVNLSQFMNSIVLSFIKKSNDKNIQIHVHDMVPDYEIETDITKLKLIIDNLISNAITYSPFNSQVDITISKSKLKTIEGNLAVISVKDEGPGISPDEQKLLFEKFRKLSNKPTNDESTSGLGLSIVKGLVKFLGGEIICTSNIGKGSEFRVYIPEEAKIIDFKPLVNYP